MLTKFFFNDKKVQFFLVITTEILNIYTDRLLNYFTFYHPFTSLPYFWNKKWCLTTSSWGWVPFFFLCSNNAVFSIFSLNYVYTFIGIYKHTNFFLSSTNTSSKTLFLSEQCVEFFNVIEGVKFETTSRTNIRMLINIIKLIWLWIFQISF